MRPVSTLLPREHGAYFQLALPLVTSLTVAGATPAGVCVAVAATALFLAHEPLVIQTGLRGSRRQRLEHVQAGVALGVALMVSTLAGVAGLLLMPDTARWSLFVPLAPAALVGWEIASRREKSMPAQLAVALALASLAVPICLSGAPLSVALTVAAVFAVVFVAGTLAVHVVVDRVRGGGRPVQVCRMRRSLFFLVTMAASGGAVAQTFGLVPLAGVVAALPGLIGAAVLAIAPPPPARLKSVGWTLAATSAAAAVMLVLALP